jgi:hypothetical protein
MERELAERQAAENKATEQYVTLFPFFFQCFQGIYVYVGR